MTPELNEQQQASLADAETNLLRNAWSEAFGGPECFEDHKSKVTSAYREALALWKERGQPPTEAHIIAMSAARDYFKDNAGTIKSAINLERFKATSMKRFMEAGGSESEFRAQWPQIRADYLRAATTAPSASELERERRAKESVRTW